MLKKNWHWGLFLLVIVAVLLILSEIFGLFSRSDVPMAFVPDGILINFAPQNFVDIHVANDGFFLANDDGMRFFDMDGLEVFSHNFTMEQPAMIGRGDFAAVAERRGHTLHVYSTSDNIFTIRSESPIISFSLSIQGLVSVVSYNNGTYEISVYESTGRLNHIIPYNDTVTIPIATDISDDGQILAISFLNINDAQMRGAIQFRTIRGNGAEQSGEVFAMSLESHNQVIGAIRFMDGNGLIAISDQRFFLINPDNSAQIVWEIELNNHIFDMNFGNDWFAMGFGDPILNRSGYPSGTIVAYDLSGDVIFSHENQGRITQLVGRSRDLIVGIHNHFTALNHNGDILWQYSAPTNVNSLHFFRDRSTAISLSTTDATMLSWRRINQ